jgi:hypothetical protein
MINLCITMFEPVGYHQPSGFMDRIVTGGLVKHPLRDFDSRGFTFNHHDPLSGGIEDHNVSPLL